MDLISVAMFALNVKVVRNSRQTRVNSGRSHDSLKVASALFVKVNGNSLKRCSTQRRPDEHLRAALQVPRVRLPAGYVQRRLARDAAVRHSGARSDPLRAVAGAARPRRAPRDPSPITSRSAAEVARGGEHEGRPRFHEEVLDAPEELRQPVVGVGGAQEKEGRKRCAL